MTRPATSSQWTQEDEDYEAIRRWSLARPRPNSAPSGAALLLRRGMAAWLLNGLPEVLTTQVQSQIESGNAESFNPSIRLKAQEVRAGSLALVLATMVEQAQTLTEATR